MQELGRLLQQARLERNMTLDDVEELTKIRKRYLQAIEQGDFRALPGSFYARAFVKAYAEAVGLDPAQVVRMYESVLPPLHPEPTVGRPRARSRDARRFERLGVLTTRLLMLVFVALILGVSYYFVSEKMHRNSPPDRERITDSTPKPGESGTGSPASPTPTVSSKPSPSAVVTRQQAVGRYEHYAVSNTDVLRVELNVVRDECWVQIMKLTGSGKAELVDQGIFKAGDRKVWEFDSSLQLVLGRPAAVTVEINGVLLDTGNSVNPKRFQINLERFDAQVSPLGSR